MTNRPEPMPSPDRRAEPILDPEARAHLDALDRLLAAGTISADERASERERTLALAASGGGRGRRRSGRSGWLLGAVAGAVALALLLGVAVVAADRGGQSDTRRANARERAYIASIARPLDHLSRSAVVVGRSLAAVSEPAEVRHVNRVAERQLDVVEASRRTLAETAIAPEERAVHRTLVRAVAQQRAYLVALARAASDSPTAASVAAVNRARRAGGRVVSRYRVFFALAPSAPDVITGSDLADTSGLRMALIRSIEARAARRSAAPPILRHGPVESTTDPSAEADRIFAAIRAGDYSNLASAERLYYELQSTSNPLRGNAAFNAGVLRYANGDCAGAAEALSAATRVSGTATQNATRLRALTRADEGCLVPASTLIG